MPKILRNLFLCFISIYVLPSIAQSFKPQDSNKSLEIIEVTAQKRIQSVQEVPMSITAISANALAVNQITQASDITSLVPNVNATRSIGGISNYFIRGVGMDGFNLSSVPAVGLYLDDVAINNPMLANFALYDIHRVEILKGPQNTLYGKNTTGGAINFITHLAELNEENSGYGLVTLGNHNQQNVEGAISAKLNETLSFRISGFSKQRDGLVTSEIEGNNTEYNDIDQYGLRAQFAYQFNDQIKINMSLYSGKQQQIAEIKTAMSAEEGEQVIKLTNVDLTTNHSSIINPPNDIDALGGYFKINITKPSYIFNSITSFEQVESERMDDWGSQQIPSALYQVFTYNSTNTDYFGQEFQWQSNTNNNFQWIGGLLYSHEQGDLLQVALIDPAGPGRPDDGIDDAGIGPMFDRGAWVENNSETLSVYGQVSYKLSQQLNVTAGYRWSHQDLSPVVNSAGMMMDLPGQEFPLGTFGWYSLGNHDLSRFEDYVGFNRIQRFVDANNGFSASEKIEQQYSDWGGKLALDYKLSQQVKLYGALSRGFKMGSINSNPTTAAYTSLLNKEVKPETLITTELGFKSDFHQNTLRINGAVFHNNWEEYQSFLVYNPGNPANLFASLVNIPGAKSIGAELDVHWQASSTMRFDLGFGWLDSEVVDANLDTSGIPLDIVDGFQRQVIEGNELTNAPKFNYTAAVHKRYELSNSAIEFSLHYHYLGKHTHQLQGTNSDIWLDNSSERSVGIVTLNSLYSFGQDREYQVSFWVKNLTDEQYCTERGTTPGTSTETVRLCSQADPKLFGINARVIF